MDILRTYLSSINKTLIRLFGGMRKEDHGDMTVTISKIYREKN